MSTLTKFILLLFLLSQVNVFGQSNKVYHKTYTKQEGLSIDTINSLCFDNDGFLWIGGSNLDSRSIVLSDKTLTLQRFNGFTFHDIPLPNIDAEIIDVHQIYKRKDGNLYIRCLTGNSHILFLFNPKTTEFTEVKFYNNIIIDALSDVINFNGKDYILSQKEREITLNILNPDLSTEPLFSFDFERNKYLLDSSTKIIPFEKYCIISDDNFPITIFDWKGSVLKRFERNTSNKNNWIDEHFIQNTNLYMFLNNNTVLHKFDSESLDFSPLKNPSANLNNEHLNCFSEDVIISSLDKMLSFSSFNSNSFNEKYTTTLTNINGIKVTSALNSSDLWLSTNGELHYFNFPTEQVKTYIENTELRAIQHLSNNNYLAATESNGWFQLDTKNDSISSYKIYSDKGELFPTSSRNIIVEDSVIWSNDGSNILKINKKTKQANLYKHYPITALEKANDSLIVYSTRGYNLMSFNVKTEEHIPLIKTDSLDIYDIEINSKNKDFVVAGTNKGVLTYNLKTKETAFHNSLDDNFVLMTDYHEDFGYLIGTRSGYVFGFNEETKTFNTIYKDELNAGIATILFEDNQLWIQTFNGIVVYNYKDKTQVRYSEREGFTHHEANRYSALQTPNGFLVGCIKGLNYFNPKDLNKQQDQAQLSLLRIMQYDKNDEVFKDYYNINSFQKVITIPSENRSLEIDFGLQNINAVDKGYSFRYKLNDNEWINLKKKNSIEFPNLASGSYNLEIEALDFSGNRLGKPLEIQIKSKEFFYKTWWFFTIISISVIGFLMWLLKLTKKRKELQQQFSQELIKSQETERKKIAKELHDSIGQQLTLIKRKAQNTNQDEISSLTNNTLEEIRAISRGLYPPLLKQFGLKESIEQLTLEVDEQTDLFVTVEVDNIDKHLNEEQTLNCYRFIQECISNTIKHANAKALSITLKKIGETAKIIIKDNGKGFDTTLEQTKNSLGLKTLNERIRILEGELNFDSKINKGTTITAIIPLKND